MNWFSVFGFRLPVVKNPSLWLRHVRQSPHLHRTPKTSFNDVVAPLQGLAGIWRLRPGALPQAMMLRPFRAARFACGCRLSRCRLSAFGCQFRGARAALSGQNISSLGQRPRLTAHAIDKALKGRNKIAGGVSGVVICTVLFCDLTFNDVVAPLQGWAGIWRLRPGALPQAMLLRPYRAARFACGCRLSRCQIRGAGRNKIAGGFRHLHMASTTVFY